MITMIFNFTNIVLFLSAALIFQAGWMIDFSLTDSVYIPFFFKTYQIKGTTWFNIAYSYLIAAGILILISVNSNYFIPFYLIYLALITWISINRWMYLDNKINLTIYGQRYNLLFYSAILALVVGLFVSGVF